jgi:hypothetical protein
LKKPCMKHSKWIVRHLWKTRSHDPQAKASIDNIQSNIHKTFISVLAISNKKHFVTIMGNQTTSRGNVHAHKDMQRGNWKINNFQIAWKKFKQSKRINLNLKDCLVCSKKARRIKGSE